MCTTILISISLLISVTAVYMFSMDNQQLAQRECLLQLNKGSDTHTYVGESMLFSVSIH